MMHDVNLPLTFSGELFEYTDDPKIKEKHRQCWIKDGFFYLAKSTKADKPVKQIDLSDVIVLDESDPSSSRHSFRLDYSKEHKPRSVCLRANDAETADRWMVALSMGILFHRLTGSTAGHRDTYIDKTHAQASDYEFVTIAEEDLDPDHPSRKSTSSSKLGLDIKREIVKKMNEDRKSVFVAASNILNKSFPSPNTSPTASRFKLDSKIPALDETDNYRVDVDEQTGQYTLTISGAVVGETDVDAVTDDTPKIPVRSPLSFDDEVFDKNVGSKSPPVPPRRQLKLDQMRGRVISQAFDEADDSQYDTLDDVPSSALVHDLMEKYEGGNRPTDRRTSTTSTQSNRSQRGRLEKTFSFTTFLKRSEKTGTGLDSLSLAELRGYKEDLDQEKLSLFRCIRDLGPIVAAAKEQRRLSRTETNRKSSEGEYQTLINDLSSMRKRLRFVDKELKRLNTAINRKVAASMGGRNTNNKWHSMTEIYGNAALPLRSPTHATDNALSPKRPRHPSVHQEGYNSEPLLDAEEDQARHRRRSRDEKSQSIII